jgi:hypothetical protein
VTRTPWYQPRGPSMNGSSGDTRLRLPLEVLSPLKRRAVLPGCPIDHTAWQLAGLHFEDPAAAGEGRIPRDKEMPALQAIRGAGGTRSSCRLRFSGHPAPLGYLGSRLSGSSTPRGDSLLYSVGFALAKPNEGCYTAGQRQQHSHTHFNERARKRCV